MLCDFCHKNIATIHLTELVGGKITEIHICSNCARSKASQINENIDISNFLEGLIEDLTKTDKTEAGYKCSNCGMSYLDFKKKGRFGCANCYISFKKLLLPLLRKIHGSTTHVGKVPKKIDKEVLYELRLKNLKVSLERAIQLEEYEEAAKIRDEIKKVEEKRKDV
jgi:protein arginine kinase activator